MKATEQYFPVVLFIMLYKVVLTFESVDEILKCDHLNKSFLAVLTFGKVYYAVQKAFVFWVCRVTIQIKPFLQQSRPEIQQNSCNIGTHIFWRLAKKFHEFWGSYWLFKLSRFLISIMDLKLLTNMINKLGFGPQMYGIYSHLYFVW